MNEMKTIVCYGDSNTWGYRPADGRRAPYQDVYKRQSLQCMTAKMWRRACPDGNCEFIKLR